MKVIWRFIKGIIISVWALAALITTICLLFYNTDYGYTEFGSYSLFIVDSDRLEPTFVKNDIVIVNKASEKAYANAEGQEAFFCVTNAQDAVFVNLGKIDKVEQNDYAEDAYFFGDKKVSYSSMIGLANGSIVYHKVGGVLAVFESRVGFLFFVVFPTLFALVFEIYSIVEEAKSEAKEELRRERENN